MDTAVHVKIISDVVFVHLPCLDLPPSLPPSFPPFLSPFPPLSFSQDANVRLRRAGCGDGVKGGEGDNELHSMLPGTHSLQSHAQDVSTRGTGELV